MANLRLSILGAGKVGQTLGCLWQKQKIFDLHQILNRSLESARQAVSFIQAGRAVASISDLDRADIFLISTADSSIVGVLDELIARDLVDSGTIVFHCSGALPSTVLSAATKFGAEVASVHPLQTFAVPIQSVDKFTGTYCGVEGTERALAVLRPAFEQIGGNCFELNVDKKIFYHAATVMVCNYLTALIEAGIKIYSHAGLDSETALKMIQPIVTQTISNIFRLGTVQALTGPIARGDMQIVAQQHKVLSGWNPEIADLYAGLGRLAIELANKKGLATKAEIEQIAKLFKQFAPEPYSSEGNQ